MVNVNTAAEQTQQTQNELQVTNPVLVYYISRSRDRSKVGKGIQLRLGEYGGMNDMGEVKALATLHTKYAFLSGMPAAYKSETGNTFWTNKEGRNDDTFFSVQVNFSAVQMQEIESKIEEVGETLSKPPKNEQGRSQLRGYQLQVTLTPGAMARFNIVDDNFKVDKEEVIIDPSEVVSVKVVTFQEDGYLRSGHQIGVTQYFEVRCKAQHVQAPKTTEETREFLASLHKDPESKARKDRRNGRSKKAAKEGAATEVKTEVVKMD